MNIKVGDVLTTNKGSLFEIIEIKNSRNISIKFLDKFNYIKTVTRGSIKSGFISNPYFPTVYRRGYLGVGYYKRSVNSKDLRVYKIWSSMLARCYNIKNNRFNSYGGIGINVCEEWHNFQKFAGWYYTQNFSENPEYQLDKDILGENEKQYSPKFCRFIPYELNSMLSNTRKKEKAIPVGVSYDKVKKKYKAQFGKTFLGLYDDIDTAFYKYRDYKEKYIYDKANEYYAEGKICKDIKEGLLKYKVRRFTNF